jgi:hypothetical protein
MLRALSQYWLQLLIIYAACLVTTLYLGLRQQQERPK